MTEEPKPLETYYRQADLCRIADVSDATVNNWIKSGAIERHELRKVPHADTHLPRFFTFKEVLKTRIIRELVKMGRMRPTEASLFAEMAASALHSAAIRRDDDKPLGDALHMYVWVDEDGEHVDYKAPDVAAVSLPASNIFDKTFARAVEILTPQEPGELVPE